MFVSSGSEDGEEGAEGEPDADNGPESSVAETQQASDDASVSDKEEPLSEDEKRESSSPISPAVKLERSEQPVRATAVVSPVAVVVPATVAMEDKPPVEIKRENGISGGAGVKTDCVAAATAMVTPKPDRIGGVEKHLHLHPPPPPPPPLINTKNEHLEKLKQTLQMDMLNMNNKWRDTSGTQRRASYLETLSMSHRHRQQPPQPTLPSMGDIPSMKRRPPPPDAVQRLPESMRSGGGSGDSLRESFQSRRLPPHDSGVTVSAAGSFAEKLRETSSLTKRSLGPIHPTEIPLKKHHKMPPSRPVYYSDSDDSDDDYRPSVFRGRMDKKISTKLFRPPIHEQNQALDLTVKKKDQHQDMAALAMKIERHDDNCPKCESGASQYIQNKLVKSVFCEAVPRDVLASVSRLQADYSVLPSRVNLCRAVNGRCNFVVCTDCYQAFPNVGMLSLHLIATGHSSTKPVNTESLLQKGFLALVPPRTEFFSTCALRRKQRTPTTAGRKEVCVYTCTECTSSFSDFLDYTVHLTTTGHDKPDKNAPKPLRKLNAASDYPEEIPVNEVMKCLICQSSFRTLKDLTMHMVRTRHFTHVPVHDSVLYSKLGNNKDSFRAEEEEDMCIESAAVDRHAAAHPSLPPHPTLSPTTRNFSKHHHKKDADRNHRVGVRDNHHHHKGDRDNHKSDHRNRGERERGVEKDHRRERDHRSERNRDHHRGDNKQEERHRRKPDARDDSHHHKEQKLAATDDRGQRSEESSKESRHRQRFEHWKEESMMHFKQRYKYDHRDDKIDDADHLKDVKYDPRDEKKVVEDGLASSNAKQVLNQMLASKKRNSTKSGREDGVIKGLGKKNRSLKCIGCEHLFADVPKLSKHMKETGHYMMPPDGDDIEQKLMPANSPTTPNGEYPHFKMAASWGKHHKHKTAARNYLEDDTTVVKMEDYFADNSDDEDDFFNQNEKPEVEKLQEKVDSMFSSESGTEKDTASSTTSSSAPVVECVGKYVDPDNFDVVYPTGSRIAGSMLGSNPLGSLASMVETAKDMNFTRTAAYAFNSEHGFGRRVFQDEAGCSSSVQAASEDSYKTAAAAAAAAAVAAAAAEAARSAAARAAAAARSSALVSAAASRPSAMYHSTLTCATSAIKKEWDDAKLFAKCAKKHKEDGLSNVTVAEAIEKILSSSFNFIKEEERSASASSHHQRGNHVSGGSGCSYKRRKQATADTLVASSPRPASRKLVEDDRNREEAKVEKQRNGDCDDERDCDVKDTDSRTESQSSTPCPMEQEDSVGVEKKQDNLDKMDREVMVKSVSPSGGLSVVPKLATSDSPLSGGDTSGGSDSQEMSMDEIHDKTNYRNNNKLNDLKLNNATSPVDNTTSSSQQVSVVCENHRVTRRTAQFLSHHHGTTGEDSSDGENLQTSPPPKVSSSSPTGFSVVRRRESSTPSLKSSSEEMDEAMSETEAERNVVCVKRELRRTPSPVQNGAKTPELSQQRPKIERTIPLSPCSDGNDDLGRDSSESSLDLSNDKRGIPSPPLSSRATDLAYSPIVAATKFKIKQEPRDDNTPSPNNHHGNGRLHASPVMSPTPLSSSKPLNNNTEVRHHSPPLIKSSVVTSATRTTNNKYSKFINSSNSIPNKYHCPSPFTSSNSTSTNPLMDLDKLVNSTTSTIQSPPPKIAKFSAEVFSRRYVKRPQDLYINPASENHLSTNPLEEMDKMVSCEI